MCIFDSTNIVYHIMNVILFNHVARFHDPGICLLIFVGSPNKVEDIHFTTHTCKLTLGNVGGVILPTLFTRIVVHLGIIHIRQCSSPYYSPRIIFLVALRTENIDTIHDIITIHTHTVHYSYQRKFLPTFCVSSHEGKIVSKAHVRCYIR